MKRTDKYAQGGGQMNWEIRINTYTLLLLLLLSCFSVSDSVRPHRRQPTRLPRPWDSLGKSTGVGCHFLLQCMKVKGESEVAQSGSPKLQYLLLKKIQVKWTCFIQTSCIFKGQMYFHFVICQFAIINDAGLFISLPVICISSFVSVAFTPPCGCLFYYISTL